MFDYVAYLAAQKRTSDQFTVPAKPVTPRPVVTSARRRAIDAWRSGLALLLLRAAVRLDPVAAAEATR
jgi:hypothetical protein